MAKTWTRGVNSNSETLTDDDDIYPVHINELRTGINSPIKDVYGETYMATDYGIVGNGVVDDTAAIQALINSISIYPQGGGYIFFPKGAYKITTTIDIGNSVSIEGAGMTATYFVFSGSGDAFYIHENVFGSLFGTQLRNFAINCAGQTGNGHGIHFYNATANRVENVYVVNAQLDGIQFDHSSHYSIIRGCSMSSVGRDGYSIIENPDTFLVESNFAYYCGRNSYSTKTGSTYTEFIGNTAIASGACGFYVGSGHVTIVGNRILGVSRVDGDGIASGVYIGDFNSAGYCKVVGNEFFNETATNHPKHWIEEISGSDYNVITGNVLGHATIGTALNIVGTHTEVGINSYDTSVTPDPITAYGGVKITGAIKDVSGNELLLFSPATNAVNEVTVANQSTGNNPGFLASGADSSINLGINSKGTTGMIIFGDVQTAGVSLQNNQPICDGSKKELIKFTTAGANLAVNEITIANNGSGTAPIISASGDDTNVSLQLAAKGTTGAIFGTFPFAIGTTSPTANTILDLGGTTKAFLPPRLSTTNRDAISGPVAGMIAFNSTTNKLNVYGSVGWEAITSG